MSISLKLSRIPVAGSILICALCFIVAGCSTKDEVDAQLDSISESHVKHPVYPIYKLIDHGQDNDPFPMMVFGNYSYIRIASHSENQALTEGEAKAKFEAEIKLAIADVKGIEQESPAPTSTPTRAEWKKEPHPTLGSYLVQVDVAPNFPPALVAGSADQSISEAAEKLAIKLQTDEKALLASNASNLPPAGFSVTSAEALAAVSAQRGKGGDPYLRGDSLLVLPQDSSEMVASLKRAVGSEVEKASKFKHKSKGVNIVVQGPNGEARFQVSSSKNTSDDIERGLKPAIDWINDASKKS
jgi:hypothetical protein